jgi:hypothetical protein
MDNVGASWLLSCVCRAFTGAEDVRAWTQVPLATVAGVHLKTAAQGRNTVLFVQDEVSSFPHATRNVFMARLETQNSKFLTAPAPQLRTAVPTVSTTIPCSLC